MVRLESLARHIDKLMNHFTLTLHLDLKNLQRGLTLTLNLTLTLIGGLANLPRRCDAVSRESKRRKITTRKG